MCVHMCVYVIGCVCVCMHMCVRLGVGVCVCVFALCAYNFYTEYANTLATVMIYCEGSFRGSTAPIALHCMIEAVGIVDPCPPDCAPLFKGRSVLPGLNHDAVNRGSWISN